MTTGYAVGLSPQERFLRIHNPYGGDDDMGLGMDPDFGYDASAGRVGLSSYQLGGMNGYNNYGGGYAYNQGFQGGYGVGPRRQGETQEAYNKRIEDFEDAQFERQIQLQLRNQNAQSRVQAPQDVVLDKVEMLASQIKRGEQDKISPAFDALVKAIKDKYMVNDQPPKGMTDAKLTAIARAEAKKVYAQTTGVPLTDHIEAEGSGSFWQGMKKILSFGFADNNCAADNIAHVEGDTVNKSTKAGKILGGLTVGGVLGSLLVMFATKGKKATP